MSCEICSTNFKRTNEKGAQPLECRSCHMKCHRYCYGYNNNTLLCDPCHDNAKKPTCCVCGQKGLLKRLSDQQCVYVHVSCAIFSPQIQVISYHSMSFVMRLDKKSKEKCTNCTKPGATVQCVDCKQAAHPHCIFSEQLEREEEENETDQWLLNLRFIPNNHDPNALHVSPNLVKHELRSVQEALLNAYDKLKKKVKNINQHKEQTRIATEQWVEQFRFQSHEPFQWQPQEKVLGYCQQHMETHRVFCVCRDSLNNAQMVQCENCYEWYHYSCIKRKNLKDVQYVCEACKVWANKRTKISIDEPVLLSFEDLVIPKEVYILHLIDLLPIMLYVEAIYAKLPTMPLRNTDFVNLKFYKLFLASMPIQPSTVIELDNILIKEVIMEELKARLQSCLPNFKQQELNQLYAAEVVQQLSQRGYLLELDENNLIKTQQVSRHQLKEIIRQGCQEGYLNADVLQQLNQSVRSNYEMDYSRVVKSSNETLLKAMERYRVAQVIKENAIKLFELSDIDLPNTEFSDQLTLLNHKSELYQQYQLRKPNKDKLQELNTMAYLSNVTLKTLTVINDLIEELGVVEECDDLNVIIEFPITSDLLNNRVRLLCEQIYINEVSQQLEHKINEGIPLSESEYRGAFCLENIHKAAKVNANIKQALIQLMDALNQVNQLKKLTVHSCADLLQTINSCPITCEQLELAKQKVHLFQHLYARIQQPITMQELRQIEETAQENGFELEIDVKRQLLQLAEEELIKQIDFDDNISDYARQLKSFNSTNANHYADCLLEQVKFITNWHQLVYGKIDTIPKMIAQCGNSNNTAIPVEVLQRLSVPTEHIHAAVLPIVQQFNRILWVSSCKEALQHPIDPNTLQQLLTTADTQTMDSRLIEQLNYHIQQYNEWITNFNELVMVLDNPKSKEFSICSGAIIKLINTHVYTEDHYKRLLWQRFMWVLWTQKAHQFIEEKASLYSLKLLLSVGIELAMPANAMMDCLRKQVETIEDLTRKLREYYEQRSVWAKNISQEVGNLKSYKSFHKYNEAKPDANTILKICNQALELKLDRPEGVPKLMNDDVQEIKALISQFNNLVTKEPENAQFIVQLQKLRHCYCLCFLKVKNFSLLLMFNLVKQQSLKCLKQLTPTSELLERLDEINTLIGLGGEGWYQRFCQNYKAPEEQPSEFKLVDNSLLDDYEWVKWVEQDSQNIQEQYGLDVQKKGKKEIKIQKKKQADCVNEQMRTLHKNQIMTLLHKNQHIKVTEQQIRMLETQIFMEHNVNKVQYEKEMTRVKYIAKMCKHIELTYEGIKKQYKQLVVNRKSNKQSVKLDSIKVIKVAKPQQQPQHHKVAINTHQELMDLEPEKKSKVESQMYSNYLHAQKVLQQQSQFESINIEPQPQVQAQQPQQQPIITAETLFYNPDGGAQQSMEPEPLLQHQSKPKKELMNIGKIQLQVTHKNSINERIQVPINPSLLTYNAANACYFQNLKNLEVSCDSFSPVQQVNEYFHQQRRDPNFKMIIGWVYSSSLSIASDLFKLADRLKSTKQCVGCKHNNTGITLMYYEYLNKLKPTTKWILLNEQLENPQVMNSLQKYQNLEKYKPHLCFVLYAKDVKQHTDSLICNPVNYTNIYKIPTFTKVIDNHKLQIKQQQIQLKNKTRLEPISDEDKNNKQQELHTMMMEIPNIMNLLD